MIRSAQVAPRDILRWVLLAVFPWFPAYLFERIDFYFGVSGNGYWYSQFSGTRLEADIVSFALGGILVAYLLRPRWALVQVFLSSLLIWVLYYVACPTFRGAEGLLHSECYQPGPDGFAGIRLTMMMFAFGALPPILKAASRGEALSRKSRSTFALFAGIIITLVMTWFPLTAWFSGVTYLPPLVIFQALILVGVPQIETGILAARIGRSIRVATLSGVVSLLFVSVSFWTLMCPGCDRSLLQLLVPLWAFFAFLGGVLELGYTGSLRWKLFWLGRVRLKDARRVAVAVVITISIWTLVAYAFWDPSVLYATPISPKPGNLTLGLPSYPYVAGYYNSIQYRVCCLEIGVSFTKAELGLLAPDNFLVAGMGVQSPNCCIDGWDFGWRADLFLLPDRSMIVSASSWETCDGNANCGGHFWQNLRYHAQATLNPANLSSPVFLRMMWEPSSTGPLKSQVNWYYNTTTLGWQKFGNFVPDFREGAYFDIGVVGCCGAGNTPQRYAYFYQFGVASKTPVRGWSVLLMYPSFQYQGSWRLMEKANIIQGQYSFWKANYRWGGEPYPGVTALANALDPSFKTGILQLSFTGKMLKDNTPLW